MSKRRILKSKQLKTQEVEKKAAPKAKSKAVEAVKKVLSTKKKEE